MIVNQAKTKSGNVEQLWEHAKFHPKELESLARKEA